MVVRNIKILALMFSILLFTFVDNGNALSGFEVGSIPFGSTVKEALEKFPGAEVTRDQTPYIESIGNYAIRRYFRGGLQKDESGICFLPGIVRKYTVKETSRAEGGAITLYFGAFEKNADDYRLFMVKETGPKPPAEGDYAEIFREMALKIDRQTGVMHTVDQGRVQSFEQKTHTFYLPALVGTWNVEDTLVFLMVAGSPDGPLPPEKVYVSRPALKRYLEICKTY